MPFFACHHVARTHGAGVSSTGSANADATQHGFGKTVPIFAIVKMRFWLPGIIVYTQSQILVVVECVDDLAGIHSVLWIPNGFEFTERLYEFLTEHDG